MAELLSPFLPSRLQLLSGVVFSERGDVQLDVMAVDTTEYPIAIRVGDHVVVDAGAVKVLVETKSKLGPAKTKNGSAAKGQSIYEAIVQAGRAGHVIGAPVGSVMRVLWSFDGPSSNSELKKWLEDVLIFRSDHQKSVGDPKLAKSEKKKLLRKLESLESTNWPDWIMSSDAMATKARDQQGNWCYEFRVPVRSDVPVVATLVRNFVSQISIAMPSSGTSAKPSTAFSSLLESINETSKKDVKVGRLAI